MCGARRLVAEHQRVGLAAVDQRQRHAGVGGVEEAALALDQVPVVGVVVGRQPLDRAGHEVGDHRVERHAVAGDEDAGLAGGAEGRGHAAGVHLPLHRERGVHLADRAVGADGEAAPAGAALAVGDRVAVRRHADVVQPAAVRHRRGDELRLVAQQVVQAGGEVEPGASASVEDADPGGRDHPAAVGDADDQRPGPGGGGLGDGHVGQAHVGLAALHAVLADGGVGAPVADALRHLGRERVGRVAEEEQVGGLDHGALPSPAKSRGGVEPRRRCGA